ncbi:Sensor histidine kinase TmoS [Planctomycetes bacterium Poly30]|uniref:histidine kinase n=2 Tax=Saltatorellus ferox TaxID=2528018 RepID=A0A518ER34_9BACT|nr:Sensor histidine kinase TmoS [Planctomycetes bacterium Poly30]
MLDAARVETGKLILTRRSHDLVAVVRDALESVRAGALSRGITVTTEGMDGPLERDIDPNRIYQVVANLLSNAIKFTPDNGQIEVVIARAPGGGALVRIGDSGPGIESGDEGRVFDRLYQSHANDAAVLGGLGMGLFISQQIVHLHGGQLSGGRSPLGGAEFTCQLP